MYKASNHPTFPPELNLHSLVVKLKAPVSQLLFPVTPFTITCQPNIITIYKPSLLTSETV